VNNFDFIEMEDMHVFLILQERLSKEKESVLVQGGAEASNSSSGNSSAVPTPLSSGTTTTTTTAVAQRRPQADTFEPDVNEAWLLQLMDMGFSREHCVEALLHAPNVEQATDYLLSNPSPFACTTQVGAMSSSWSPCNENCHCCYIVNSCEHAIRKYAKGVFAFSLC
jgi:hypothetical protein